MSVWNVSTRNDNSVGTVEAPTKASALAKARRLYGNKGERDWMHRPTKQAVYVQKISGNTARRNPGGKKPTKLQRLMSSTKRAKQKRMAKALNEYLKVRNPGTKLAGAKVIKNAGGSITIIPIKLRRAK